MRAPSRLANRDEAAELAAHSRTAPRLAVTRQQCLGLERRQPADGTLGRRPVLGEIRWRPVHGTALRGDRDGGLLLHRDQCVAAEQRPIAVTEKRDVDETSATDDGVAASRTPLPTRPRASSRR